MVEGKVIDSSRLEAPFTKSSIVDRVLNEERKYNPDEGKVCEPALEDEPSKRNVPSQA